MAGHCALKYSHGEYASGVCVCVIALLVEVEHSSWLQHTMALGEGYLTVRVGQAIGILPVYCIEAAGLKWHLEDAGLDEPRIGEMGRGGACRRDRVADDVNPNKRGRKTLSGPACPACNGAGRPCRTKPGKNDPGVSSFSPPSPLTPNAKDPLWGGRLHLCARGDRWWTVL